MREKNKEKNGLNKVNEMNLTLIKSGNVAEDGCAFLCSGYQRISGSEILLGNKEVANLFTVNDLGVKSFKIMVIFYLKYFSWEQEANLIQSFIGIFLFYLEKKRTEFYERISLFYANIFVI